MNGSGTKTAGHKYEMPVRNDAKNHHTICGIMCWGRKYDTDEFVKLLLNNLLEDSHDTMEKFRNAT